MKIASTSFFCCFETPDKALADFFKWLSLQGEKGIDISNFEFNSFLKLSYVSQNALIIEWFDSVGIYIDVYICTDKTFDFRINTKFYNTWCNTRQQATKQAIIKANEIYNETHI